MTATQDVRTTPTAAGWPPGLPRTLEYPAVPVGSILRAAVRRWGDKTAFLDNDVPLTFEEMGRGAHAVGGWLVDHGIGRGDVVAVHVPICRQYPPLYCGIMLAYTGGTTGVSTSVELPHRHVVVANVLQSACWTSGSLPELDEHGDVTIRQVLPPEEMPTRLGGRG